MLPAEVSALSITLGWNANTETNLAGYKLHYGPASRTYTNSIAVGNVTTYTVTNLANGVPFYFAVTAVNTLELESDYSNEVAHEPPNSPPVISPIDDVTISEDAPTSVIAFTISDQQTPLNNLQVTRSSSNTSLVPNANIVLGGTGGNRTVIVTPVANGSGSATITITVSDGSLTTNETFVVNVTGVNDAPTVTDVIDQTILEDTSTAVLAVTLADLDTSAGALQFSANSSDVNLLPPGGIILGGSGLSRTIQLFPTTNRSGSATITLRVDDGSSTSLQTFTLNVTEVNDDPEISPFAAITLDRNTSSGPIPFTISDIETPVASLALSAMSSNTTVVPLSGIAFGGSGANRTITVTPATNQTGLTRIAVRVSDGVVTNREYLYVTVVDSNSPPSLTVPTQLTTPKETAVAISGILRDPDSGSAPLTFTLRARYGTIRVQTGGGGVNGNQIQGNNTTNVVITAARSAINNTWAQATGITYTGLPDFAGTDTVTIIANDNGNSGVGGPMIATAIVAITVTGGALDTWRAQFFTADELNDPTKEPTHWGDGADPDNDGHPNVFEYALGLNPRSSDQLDTVLVPGVTDDAGNRFLTLAFPRRLNAPELQYLPEVSSDEQTWSGGATLLSTSPLSADFERVTYRDITPITTAAPRFMRLRVVQSVP